MMKREHRTFTPEFKKQMVVQLHQNGKTKRAIIEEYNLTPSSLDRWIQQDETSGSFKEKDNRSLEQQELLKLRKENKQLVMENDILKRLWLISSVICLFSVKPEMIVIVMQTIKKETSLRPFQMLSYLF